VNEQAKGRTVGYGELCITSEIVSLAGSAGLEFGMLYTIWEERFIPQSELRSQAQSSYTYEKI
jgi:hypothetical protein